MYNKILIIKILEKLIKIQFLLNLILLLVSDF